MYKEYDLKEHILQKIVGICMVGRFLINVLLFCCMPSIFCGTITLTIRPYPNIHKTIKHIKKTGTLSHEKLAKMANPSQVAGIFATYAGFVESSDHFGQIIFTRRQTNSELFVLITNQIIPIAMFKQTIDHWELKPGAAAHMYKFSRVLDTDTNLTYWDVQETPIPDNNRIPLDTMVIIAHPKNILVPIGITLSDSGPNLLLPPIYTRKGINVVDNSLYVINLNHLFGQVHLMHSKKPSYYAIQPDE